MLIYVNGCSYARISGGKTYSDFLGEQLNCPSINAAHPGSCNSRIIRTSLRDLILHKKTHNDIVAVISLSFLIRTEMWDLTHSNQQWREYNDGDFFSEQFVETLDWYTADDNTRVANVDKKYKEFAISWLSWYNVEAETVKLLQNLILFTGWCEKNNIKYIIFSGPQLESIDFNAPFVESFYSQLIENDNIINPFKYSFLDWCTAQGFAPTEPVQYFINGEVKAAGHQGESAHKAWAQYLIENYLTEL
jgi:hypothetical protein